MENFLLSKEYWGMVENEVPAATEGVGLTDVQRKHIDDQKLKDLKAKNYLFQALDRFILEFKDTKTLTIYELQNSLLVHEQYMSYHIEEKHALKITYATQSRGRGLGHGKGRGRGRGKQIFDKATIECYHCHKLGVESSLQLNILEFLVVLLMFMCLTTIEPSWMIRV